jgi:hypothetical protein
VILFNEGEASLIPENPIHMVPAEASLLEAAKLDVVDDLEVLGGRGAEQGALPTRPGLSPFPSIRESILAP